MIIAGALAVRAVALMLSMSRTRRRALELDGGGDVQVLGGVATTSRSARPAEAVVGPVVRPAQPAADSVASVRSRAPRSSRTSVAIQPTYSGEQIVERRFGTAQQEDCSPTCGPPLASSSCRVTHISCSPGPSVRETTSTSSATWQSRRADSPLDGRRAARPAGGQGLVVFDLAARTDNLSVELQLTGDQAERLYWLQKNGDWSLILRPSNHAADKRTAPATGTTIVEASNGR